MVCTGHESQRVGLSDSHFHFSLHPHREHSCLWLCSPRGHKGSDMTERLSLHFTSFNMRVYKC